MVDSIATALEEDRLAEPATIDEAIAQLRGVRRRLFGGHRTSGSARERIRRYLENNAGRPVAGEELAEIAGISEWARRVRELREEGYVIEETGGNYLLVSSGDSDPPAPDRRH